MTANDLLWKCAMETCGLAAELLPSGEGNETARRGCRLDVCSAFQETDVMASVKEAKMMMAEIHSNGSLAVSSQSQREGCRNICAGTRPERLHAAPTALLESARRYSRHVLKVQQHKEEKWETEERSKLV